MIMDVTEKQVTALMEKSGELYEEAASRYLDKTDFDAHDWLDADELEIYMACLKLEDNDYYEDEELTREQAIESLKKHGLLK